MTSKNDQFSDIIDSKTHLQQIFDCIVDPIVVLDKELKIRRANLSMKQRLAAKTFKSFLGESCYEKIKRQKEPCQHCPAIEAMESGKAVAKVCELSFDGKNYQYELIAYPLRDDDGQVIGVIEYYRDINRLMELEVELFKSERNRLLGSLAAELAHEIRNPLGVISSVAQYCKEEWSLTPGLKEEMDIIVRNSDTIARMVSSLMDMSRPLSSAFEILSLSPILEEGIRFVRPKLKIKKIALSTAIPGDLPKFKLDHARFLQAYLNFLLNAIEAIPQGGRIEVEVHHQVLPPGAHILIKDTGEGISPEVREKVGQPFFSTKKEGLGLGVPIAENIIRTHGGSVSFHPREGGGTGTTVDIFIPALPTV